MMGVSCVHQAQWHAKGWSRPWLLLLLHTPVLLPIHCTCWPTRWLETGECAEPIWCRRSYLAYPGTSSSHHISLPLTSTMPHHHLHFLPWVPLKMLRIMPLPALPRTAGAAPMISHLSSCQSCSWNWWRKFQCMSFPVTTVLPPVSCTGMGVPCCNFPVSARTARVNSTISWWP